MSTTSDSEYPPLLSSPAQARTLAEGIEVPVSTTIKSSLEELAMVNISGIPIKGDPASSDGPACQRGTLYDIYILLNRQPRSSQKANEIEALPPVKKDAAKTESKRRLRRWYMVYNILKAGWDLIEIIAEWF
ncbi:MAG: hypothetical protein B7Z37_04955 [Verrucomicrobia bacterium 12-59-8]|nr:MAG: hypothetical protein B7Z37_04955 [Verrucomicrobia bacterium 12-59-8]